MPNITITFVIGDNDIERVYNGYFQRKPMAYQNEYQDIQACLAVRLKDELYAIANEGLLEIAAGDAELVST